jgi:site-specific recombinase XerD
MTTTSTSLAQLLERFFTQRLMHQRQASLHTISSYRDTFRLLNASPYMSCATRWPDLLQAGVDRSVIALWLGHESVETTQIYLEATLAMKEQALARTSR